MKDYQGEEIRKSIGKIMLAPLHSGRPSDEEPHVKKTMKGKTEKIELICRINQEELGYLEDEYEDLKALFQMFDFDQDGVVSLKEACGMLRCVGFGHHEEVIRPLVEPVSADTTDASLSFNEFLKLVALKRREAPNENNLLAVFKTFDVKDTGRISESKFRQILATKQVPKEDVDGILEEYRKLEVAPSDTSSVDGSEEQILYKELIQMLQAPPAEG